MEKQTENTMFIIKRYDNYISGANVKGNFLLAFNTFLTGGVIANYTKMSELISDTCGMTIMNVMLCLLIIASIIITVFVVNAVYPYLLSGNSSKDNYHSHIFFNSVSEFKSKNEYHESLNKQSVEDFNKDLSHQAYQLSKALKNKYNNLYWAMRIVYFELFCILSILTLIIIY